MKQEIAEEFPGQFGIIGKYKNHTNIKNPQKEWSSSSKGLKITYKHTRKFYKRIINTLEQEHNGKLY